jgi:hypothetical protein
VCKGIVNLPFLASSIAYKIFTIRKLIENVDSARRCGKIFQIMPAAEGNKNIYELLSVSSGVTI